MTSACPLCGHDQASPLYEKDGYHLVRCRGCELVRVADPPPAENLARMYSFATGYHQEQALERPSGQQLRRARSQCRVLGRLRPPGRLLDIGCSAGTFLAQARARGWSVTGLEFSPDSARVAREREGLAVMVGTVFNQDLPPASQDVITLWDVIEHMPDPLAALRRIRPCLSTDGVIVLETPNIDGLFPRLAYRIAPAIHYWPHPEPPGHLFQFSKTTITELLRRAGYSVISITDDRIPLAYSFGTLTTLMRLPKRLLYALAFSPSALIGPWLGAGDTMRVVARKTSLAP